MQVRGPKPVGRWPKLAAKLTALAVLSPAANADELPKELLLQCEGKVTAIIMLGAKPEFSTATFKSTLRLKDGSIGNIEYNFLDGKDCVLVKGEVRCELNEVIYMKELNATERRHGTVSINRATGELRMFLETWSFDGTRASGTPSTTVKLTKTGVCRPAGSSRIF